MFGNLATLPIHLATGGTTALGHGAVALGGYGARAMYDRIIRNRAEQISELMRREAPLSMMQPPPPSPPSPFPYEAFTPGVAYELNRRLTP